MLGNLLSELFKFNLLQFRALEVKSSRCDIEYGPETKKKLAIYCFTLYHTRPLLVFYSISWRTGPFTYSKLSNETPDQCVTPVQS